MFRQRLVVGPLSILSAVLVVVTGSVLTGALSLDGQPAVQAQNHQGAISNLSVSSPDPGQLVVTWSAPGETPTDYRVRWAPSGQDYLSYSESNTSERGSAYPEVVTLTVDNLPAGAGYKVQVRARYYEGQHEHNPWSGPWSDETTVTVSSPPTATPEPASDEVTGLALSSDAVGQLVVTWNQPSGNPADYRVAWAPADEDYLSHTGDNTSRRGNSYPAADTSTLTLSGLAAGVDYKVMMRARYHDEQTAQHSSGPWTDEVTQRVRADAPAAPTALSATETTSKGQTSVSLSWTAPEHSAITGYRIRRGADADSLTALVQDTGDTATGYSDAAIETGNTYVYAVTALSLDGDSPRSATASVTRAEASEITPRDPPPPDDEEEELIAQQQQGSDEVILIANYGLGTGGLDIGGAIDFTKGATQFTTGNNEQGYELTQVTHVFRLRSAGTGIVGASVYTDNGGRPGAEVYAFPDQTLTNTTVQPVTYVGEVLLERNTKYWMVLTRRPGSTVDVFISRKSPSAALTAQPGWSLTTPSSHYTSGTWTDESEINAIRLDGVVRTTVTEEPDDRDFPMDASTLGRLRVGATSTGVLDATDDKRSGDLLKIEGLTAGNSYRVRAWFGTSKEDSATAARGGAIGLQSGRWGSSHISSFSPHNDNLLDDGRASFVFPTFAGEEYYVDVVAPAFRPPEGIVAAHTYYGPYMLEIYDLGVTQRLTGVTGQTCDSDNRVCTGGTVSYSEGYGIKASNICVNNRCANDPRLPEFWYPGYATNETHEVSVGNNPTSKNLSQAAVFLATDSTSTATSYKLDRIGAFVHSMTGGSIPQAAIYASTDGGDVGDAIFELEPLYNDDRHIDYFVAPRNAPALTKNTFYYVVFSEGGGSSASYKLSVTAQHDTQDDNSHPRWPITDSGETKDNDATSPTWAPMRSGDTSSGTLVLPQITVYAGVAE